MTSFPIFKYFLFGMTRKKSKRMIEFKKESKVVESFVLLPKVNGK